MMPIFEWICLRRKKWPLYLRSGGPPRGGRGSHVLEQQRRAFREAVCEEWAGAAAGAGATRQARGVILPTGNSGKQRGDV